MIELGRNELKDWQMVEKGRREYQKNWYDF